MTEFSIRRFDYISNRIIYLKYGLLMRIYASFPNSIKYTIYDTLLLCEYWRQEDLLSVNQQALIGRCLILVQLYHDQNKLLFDEMMFYACLSRPTGCIRFHRTSPLKKQSASRNVSPLGHILTEPICFDSLMLPYIEVFLSPR